MKPLVFKIKYGYSNTDYVLTSDMAEIEKAIYARVEKIPVFINGKMIAGQEIKTIEPDIHSYTGWYRSYEAQSGDDFAQIERDVPKEAYKVLEACQKRVSQFLNSGNVEKIGKESLPPEKLLRLTGGDK